MKINREHLAITAIAMNPKTAVSARHAPLTHLLVVRDSETTGRLVAADGFMLAVVPVSLDADDVAGLVYPDALRSAIRDVSKREYEFKVTLTDVAVISVVGASFPRIRVINGDTPKTEDYTDISRITPRNVDVGGRDQVVTPLSFNSRYLDMLGKALGGCGVTLFPNPVGPTGPVVVFPLLSSGYGCRFNGMGMPVAPYGVLMPMHSTRALRVEESVA